MATLRAPSTFLVIVTTSNVLRTFVSVTEHTHGAFDCLSVASFDKRSSCTERHVGATIPKQCNDQGSGKQGNGDDGRDWRARQPRSMTEATSTLTSPPSTQRVHLVRSFVHRRTFVHRRSAFASARVRSFVDATRSSDLKHVRRAEHARSSRSTRGAVGASAEQARSSALKHVKYVNRGTVGVRRIF